MRRAAAACRRRASRSIRCGRRPLPNHWVLGNAIGVWVDEQDHVWIVHRGSDTLANNEKGLELKSADCCAGAPPVLEFDAQGNLVRHWGGPGAGYDWPASNHGIFVDHTGNVWIGGNGPGDSHIVKFTRDGKFLAQYGKPNARVSGKDAQGQPTFARNSHDPENFGRVAKIFVDPKANEAYLADGYFNKRVAVLDAATGKMKRYWGAYGNKPDDAVDARPVRSGRARREAVPQSRALRRLVERRLRLRLRSHQRSPAGVQGRRHVREGDVPREEHEAVGIGVGRGVLARSRSSAISTSPTASTIASTCCSATSLELLTSFGDGGRQPSQFYGVHSIATDSHGNIYTTETWEGKAPAEVHVSRDGAGDDDASGHGLAAHRRPLVRWKT